MCVCCHLDDDGHGEGAGGGGEVHDGGGAAAGGVGHAEEEAGAVVPGHHRRGHHRRAAGGVRVTIVDGLRLRGGVVAQEDATTACACAAAGARGRVCGQVLLRRPWLPAAGQPPARRACAGVAQGRSLKTRGGA